MPYMGPDRLVPSAFALAARTRGMSSPGDPSQVPPPRLSVGVVIPARDEREAIARVLADIPKRFAGGRQIHAVVDQVVVVDNGSTDDTAARAEEAGAEVVGEPRKGYGQACQAGIAALGECDVVVFLDGDYSDHPEEMARLLTPIWSDRADLVVGSRVLGRRQPGALPPQSRLGNLLATSLIRLLFGVSYTDLGPFRAISREALVELGMEDPDYGWTVEMQVKAAKKNLRIAEVPVSYRRRIGESKISGTLAGSFRAGLKILSTIYRHSR